MTTVTEAFAKASTEGVSNSDRLVVIEGGITDLQAEALTTQLRSKALVWDARRLAVRRVLRAIS
jgi:hypothetical protein